MKLSEKILYCRKRSGLSQEALADIIGVSRQAISKWETGESAPEVGKLLLLAKAFNVTTDWLLSEDEPQPEKSAFENSEPKQQDSVNEHTSWVDSIPGVIGKLIRRYGWLYGVYTALAGLGFTVIGTLARVLTRFMFSSVFNSGSFNGFGSNTTWYDSSGKIISAGSMASSFMKHNPVSIVGTVILIIGIIMIISGVILAIYLKKRGKRS